MSARQPPAANHRSVQELTRPRWAYSRRGYALYQGFAQLGKSRLATLFTLLAIGTTLALPALFYFLTDDTRNLPFNTQQEQSLTIFLKRTVTDLDGAELARKISAGVDIQRTDYISKDEALAEMAEASTLTEALDVLEENPLPGAILVFPAAAYQSASAIALLSTQLGDLPEVDKVNVDLAWVERLNAIINLIRLCAGSIAVFLIATALMVIGNITRLEMLRQTRHSQVAELLGASRSFVARPFVYLGAIYGALGGLVAIALALIFHWLLNPAIEQLTRAYNVEWALNSPSSVQMLWLVGSAMMMGIFTAFVSVGWRRFRVDI